MVPFGQDAHGRITLFYESLGTRIDISNRSNGASDTVVGGTLPQLMTANEDLGGTWTDLFETRHSYLDGELTGITAGGFSLNFTSDFYLEDGLAPLPATIDYSQAIATYWGGGFDPDGPTKYAVSSWTMTVTPVPIPPALYLFGSGLLGLVAIARRKQA